jgi:uncharacterized protein YndB with AHSA1/START domain
MPTEISKDLVREIDIEAAPETVFEFFVDPDKLTRWLAVDATLDPRPGGVCHQVHEGDPPQRRSFHMEGEFLAVDRPKRVVPAPSRSRWRRPRAAPGSAWCTAACRRRTSTTTTAAGPRCWSGWPRW